MPALGGDDSAWSITRARAMPGKPARAAALVLMVGPSGAATAPRWFSRGQLAAHVEACKVVLAELDAYEANRPRLPTRQSPNAGKPIK